MVTVVGKNGIQVDVVMDSISKSGKRITTMCIKYGLIVHAEFLRHRLISNSVKSNRAIPMKTLRAEVLKSPYIPVWFGAAQKGMVADNEMSHKRLGRAVWLAARYPAVAAHWLAEKLGAHKEWANRFLNPWQYVVETITFTEIENLLELRVHRDAQKDIQELARCMKNALEFSEPEMLNEGEWHVPYVTRERDIDGVMKYYDNNGCELTAQGAIVCSAARCARSSYARHDSSTTTLRADSALYEVLITSKPSHGSPCEHVATPVPQFEKNTFEWPKGVTHIDNQMRAWSGNLIGWVQYRQLLEDHVKW